MLVMTQASSVWGVGGCAPIPSFRVPLMNTCLTALLGKIDIYPHSPPSFGAKLRRFPEDLLDPHDILILISIRILFSVGMTFG